MARQRSIHEIKRLLMRRMTRESPYVRDRVAREIREHACVVAFFRGRAIASIANDTDFGAGWDQDRILAAIRNRSTLKQ